MNCPVIFVFSYSLRNPVFRGVKTSQLFECTHCRATAVSLGVLSSGWCAKDLTLEICVCSENLNRS